MSIENILVPIDFSKNSVNGLRVACDLGKKFNAKLHLVNAFHIPAPITDIGGAPQTIGTFISEYKEEAEESLEEMIELVPELKNVAHEKDVYLANTIDALYTAIEVKCIDLVVMGTRKSHDGIEHLLGGVSTEVIRFAKCPVLVIPETVHKLTLKNIAIAIDYKRIKDLGKLTPIIDLCKIYGAKLSIVHIGIHEETESIEQIMEMNELTQLFDDLDFKFDIAHGKKVRERLINYIDDNHLDLLIMMPRKHDLFERIFEGSLTKKVAIDIHIPLLTIHD